MNSRAEDRKPFFTSDREGGAPRFFWLDVMRAGAALLVCAGHLRGFLFVDWHEVRNPGLLEAVFYFLGGLGHQSVLVFFVLSGFFVGGSVVSACANGTWSWSIYSIQRGIRLWIVLVPALLLTLLWDRLGMHLSGGVGYDGTLADALSSGPTPASPARHDLPALAGNLAFLQTILVPTYGTNGPLWSLANEFWYYVLFPVCCLTWISSGARRWAYVVLAAAVAWFLPAVLLQGGILWILGVAAWQLCRRPWFPAVAGHGASLVAAAGAFAGTLAASRFGHVLGSELAIGLSCAILVACLAIRNPVSPLLGAAAARLADMSYTLYLTHFPLLAFLWFCFVGPGQFQPESHGYLVFAAGLATALAYAWLVWWCFERNTDALRRRIRRFAQASSATRSG